VIEMLMEPVSDYKYLFIYEDQLSKFTVLKALRNNTAKEVAAKLLDVLAIIGAPRVLQSRNGRKFAEQVIRELRLLWNDVLIFHGDASKHEISCKDFKSLLESWMRKNPTKGWYEGLNSLQILHNSSYRYQNGKVPYDVLFGRDMRESFQSMEKDTASLWTEEEWLEYLANKKDTVVMANNMQGTSDNTKVIMLYNIAFGIINSDIIVKHLINYPLLHVSVF